MSSAALWRWSAAAAALAALLLHLPVLRQGAPYLSFHLLYYGQPAAPLPPELPPLNPALHDQSYQLYPLLEEIRAALGRGELPLWTDSVFCGAPLLANGVAAALHPLQWLALALPGAWGPTAAAIAKTILAALLMLGYLRRLGVGPAAALLGAAGFASHGLMITFLLFPNSTVAAHLPALAWALEEIRRGAGARAYAALALACASGLLAGHPEVFFLIASGAGAYGLLILFWDRPQKGGAAPRRAAACLAAAGLGAILAGAQLIPFLDYLGRSAALGKRAGLDLHLEPGAAIVALVPDFFGHVRQGNYWGTLDDTNEAAFVSLALIVLALLPLGWPARPRLPRVLLALAAVCLLVGYGVPPVADLVRLLPGFDRALPSRINSVLAFALCALAALRLDRLVRHPAIVRRRTLAGAAALAAVLLATLAAARFHYRAWLPTAAHDQAQREALHEVVWLLLAVLIGLAWLASGRARRLALLTTAALVLLPIYRYALPFNSVVPASIDFPRPPALEALRARPGWFRAAALGAVLPPNAAALYGLKDVRGIDALTPRRYESFLRRADPASANLWRLPALVGPSAARPGSPHALQARTWRRALAGLERESPGYARRASSLLLLFDPRSPLLDLLGLRFVLTPGSTADRLIVDQPKRWRRIYRGDVDVLENLRAAPHAYLAARVHRLRDAEAAFELMSSRSFGAGRDAAVIGDPAGALGAFGQAALLPGETVRILQASPNRLRLKVETAQRRLLVLSEAYDPGWRAWIDGQPAAVLSANLVLRAVPVPAGDHQVELRYRPASWTLGLALSGLGAILLAALWAAGRRSRADQAAGG